MTISLGIVTDQLQSYGGSEVYILECIRRWQNELDIVVYAARCNEKLLKEFGIDRDRVRVKILPEVKNRKHRFDLLDDLVVRPRIWERHVGKHDLYFQYLFPAQLVRKSPSIWFAAEPLRMLYDLRHHETVDESQIAFHVYPRMKYDSAIKSDLNVVLQIIQELDRNSKIENLVTNSRMMEGYLESIYGRKADLIAYPGINLPDAWEGPVDNHTAMFVGRLWDHKRVDLIIRAIAELPRGNLNIVGVGPEEKRLKKLVTSLGLKHRVKFHSKLSNKRLARLYRDATCGVYTPIREPFGIMPLEAASYGMPVVVTQDGGYTEVLDESCAHVVSPEPARIARALDSLFSDHAVAREMGRSARRIAERHTWDHTAANLLRLFKRTLTRQSRVIYGAGYRPLLGAHYYPWYGAGENVRHWNENSDYATVTDPPLGGAYSSADPAVLAHHVDLAGQAGLDYLVANIQVSAEGPDPDELGAVDMLFRVAAERNPDLSICLMVSPDKADSSSINAAIELLERRYFPHTNYLCLQRKPLLWFFITESFIGHFFHQYATLIDATRGCYRVAASGFCYTKYLPSHYSEFFDGWTLYSPLQVCAPETWERMWGASHRDFIEHKPGQGLRVFTICPGFDDTGLTQPQRSHAEVRRVGRRGTRTYRRMQKACLALDDAPDLVVVTSFNEFHENTQIEPTESSGDRYIEATRKFSEELKSRGRLDLRQTNSMPMVSGTS